MTIPLLDFLESMSPWWWVALGTALIAFEMLVPSFFLIWPGLAALTLALLLWGISSLTGEVQVAVFALLSVAYTFVGRAIFRIRGQVESDAPSLNRRSAQLVGRHGVIVAATPDGEATVEVDGIRWSADLAGRGAPGMRVRILAADGMRLRVEAEGG
jgi:membrane protein implicated in regulation of membrane protease activity